jgi:glycosyltransferase involved in cell wall biosynthesis
MLEGFKTVALFPLNEKYSTTRLVTRKKPLIEKNPDNKFETILFLPHVEGRKGEGGLRTQGYFKSSLPDKPLITIITVVFNSTENLEQTILSVINQSYDNVEYIIIDGGSTDNTLDIIQKYESEIDYWISEPDKGIYDAMNKGITSSLGDAIGLINSGDTYLENAINNLIDTMGNKYQELKVYYGDSIFVDNINDKYLVKGNLEKLELTMSLCHQSVFVSRKIYLYHGLYKTSYQYASDYEYLLSLWSSGFEFCYLRLPISYFLTGGLSDSKILAYSLELIRTHIERGSNIHVKSVVVWIRIKHLIYYLLTQVLNIRFSKKNY